MLLPTGRWLATASAQVPCVPAVIVHRELFTGALIAVEPPGAVPITVGLGGAPSPWLVWLTAAMAPPPGSSCWSSPTGRSGC